MNESIARKTIIGIRPTGERIVIEFSVGPPYQEGPECWRTPVTLSPLYQRIAQAAGVDAIQSLCMALSLAIDLLAKFMEDGGKLLNDDGTELNLESYSFGYTVRRERGA